MAMKSIYIMDDGGGSSKNTKVEKPSSAYNNTNLNTNNSVSSLVTSTSTSSDSKVATSGSNNSVSRIVVEFDSSDLDKRQYQELKAKIEMLIEYLERLISNLEIPSEKIMSVYSIDSVGFDNEKISSIKNELTQRRNYLKYNVITEIDNNIARLSKGIG